MAKGDYLGSYSSTYGKEPQDPAAMLLGVLPPEPPPDPPDPPLPETAEPAPEGE